MFVMLSLFSLITSTYRIKLYLGLEKSTISIDEKSRNRLNMNNNAQAKNTQKGKMPGWECGNNWWQSWQGWEGSVQGGVITEGLWSSLWSSCSPAPRGLHQIHGLLSALNTLKIPHPVSPHTLVDLPLTSPSSPLTSLSPPPHSPPPPSPIPLPRAMAFNF